MLFNIIKLFYTTIFTLLVSVSLYAQGVGEKNVDYHKWTLEQLLFTIDSGLLDEEKRLDYIEFYLQKAKKEHSNEHITIGYKKKIANLSGYTIKTKYADSLLAFAHKLRDSKTLGVAYDYKSYVEYSKKKYKSALEYAFKAEEYLKKTDDLYNLNEVKYSIALIYYYIEEYEKAYKLLRECTEYQYNHRNFSYNNKKSYIIYLFSLGKATYRLQKYDTLQILITNGYEGIKELKAHHQPIENSYFALLDGAYHNTIHQYTKSDSLLEVALTHIVEEINDLSNQYLIYLYQGKNAWGLNNKEKALKYFERIDLLYQKEGFINNELTEAYNYIIEYYKEYKKPESQLHYTNILLEISNELQKSNRELAWYIHANLDTKKLQESKAQLEKELSRNKNWTVFAYGSVLILAFILVGMVVRYKRFKKNQLHNYQLLIENNNTLQTLSEEQDFIQEIEDVSPNLEIPNTAQIILHKLARFEENKGFLEKLTLDDLARRLQTNRTTLSKIINEHKGTNYNGYINKLRVDYAVKEISSKPELQELKLEALSEEFGFGNSKSFSLAFKEITNMSITDFIKLSKRQLHG